MFIVRYSDKNRPREDDSRQQTGLSSDFCDFQRFSQTPKNQQHTILVIFAFMSERYFDEKFSREFSIKQPRWPHHLTVLCVSFHAFNPINAPFSHRQNHFLRFSLWFSPILVSGFALFHPTIVTWFCKVLIRIIQAVTHRNNVHFNFLCPVSKSYHSAAISPFGDNKLLI